jgi:hypothetical protein
MNYSKKVFKSMIILRKVHLSIYVTMTLAEILRQASVFVNQPTSKHGSFISYAIYKDVPVTI